MIFERNIFQRAATPCLKDAARILDELKLNWWCEAGTCLGIVRDKDFIEHDSDIDIGVTDWRKAKLLEDALIKDGFHQIHVYGEPENGYEMAFSKHGVKIDFFFFYHSDKGLWHSAWQGKEQLFLDFKKEDILPTQRVLFIPENNVSFEVNLPADTDAYLTARYGDWKEVKKDWKWDIDPLCLRKE